MFSWFKKQVLKPEETQEHVPQEPEYPISLCPHANWVVRGTNHIGYGECLDCKREVPLAVLFNALHSRMEAAIDAANAAATAIHKI